MKNKKRENGKTNKSQRQRDDVVVTLIKGLGFLIEQAQQEKLGHAVQILKTAQEDLIYSASQHAGDETPQDSFIAQHLFSTGLFPAAAIAARVEGIKNKNVRDGVRSVLGL